MAIPQSFEDKQSIQALDRNRFTLSEFGFSVQSGCGVTISSGTLGSGNGAINVASGTVLDDYVHTSVSSTDLDVATANSTSPRKDIVVYDNSDASLKVIQGVAEEAQPTGAAREEAERPVPPSLSSSVDAVASGGNPQIPLAELWIPEGADSITNNDIFDRRTNPSALSESNATEINRISNYTAGGVADTEFDDAVADTPAGETLLLDVDIELTQQHSINKAITIDSLDHVTVTCSNSSNNDPHIYFEGTGTVNSTTTTAATNKADRVIPVNDETIFSVDDRILIMSAAYSQTVDAVIHFDEVESTSAGQITLQGGLSSGFASGVNIYLLDLIHEPEIRNVTTTGGGNRHLEFRFCEEPVFDNVTVDDYLEVSLYCADCWKPKYFSCEATNPKGLASGEGEPFALYRCQDGYVESPRVYDCRRGIDFAWGTHQVAVIDPVIRGVSLNGISVHGNDTCGDINIEGGEIICDPNGQTGNGITMSETATFYVDGVRIVARRNGFICTGEAHISNCRIEATPGNTSNQIAAINLQHGNSTVDGTVIDDPDGAYDFGVWFNTNGINMSNFDVNVHTIHPADGHIYLDARNGDLSDITVTGKLDNQGGSSDEAIFIRADGSFTINNAEFEVTALDLPNQGVRILSGGTEQVDNIRFTNCYMTTGLAAIYSDGTGTFGNITVANGQFETGSTSLSFNETVDKLILVNNTITGSIDSTGATNSTVSGNI